MVQIIINQDQLERVRNARGVWVNKGCMSCQHRNIVEGSRFCELNQRIVGARSLCPKWQMSEGMKNAGLNRGCKVRLHGTETVVID